MATSRNPQIKIVFLPYMIMAICLMAFYTILRYLLSEYAGILDVNTSVLDFYLPLGISAFLVLKYLRPRIRILNIKSYNNNIHFIYNTIAIYAMALPVQYVQQYISTAPHKLYTVSSINEIDTLNLHKYYKIANYGLLKDKGASGATRWVSGEIGQTYNYAIYSVIPLTDTIKPAYRVTFWYERKYTTAISKHLDKYEHKWALEKFTDSVQKDYNFFSLNYNCYYEVLRSSDEYKICKQVIDDTYPYIGNHWSIILKPVFEPFEKRTGNSLLISCLSFFSGAVLFFFMVWIPGVRASALRRYKSGYVFYKDSLEYLLSYLVPGKHGLFITPIVIYANVLAFTFISVALGTIEGPPPNIMMVYGACNYEAIVNDGEYWRLLSFLFLHDGLGHLIPNMLVLIVAGNVLEPVVRKGWFTVIYIISGIGAGILSMLWHSNTASVGSSGAIFGLFGAMLALVLARKQKKKLRKTYIGIIVLYAIGGIVLGMQGNVDNAAHIGGLLTGVVTGLVYIALHKEVFYTDVLLSKDD